jgi:hypothetical protein
MKQDSEYTCWALPQRLLHAPTGHDGVPTTQIRPDQIKKYLNKTVASDVEVCLNDVMEAVRRVGELVQDGEPQVVLEHLLVVPRRLRHACVVLFLLFILFI